MQISIALLGTVAVGFVFGRSFINPIMKLKRGTQEVAAGRLAGRVLRTLAVGTGVGGVSRWVSIFGLQFQFSEVAKVLMISVLAAYLAARVAFMPMTVGGRIRTLEDIAARLHSASIRLLRTLRREDDGSGLSAPRLSALSVAVVFLAYVVGAFVVEPAWGEVGRALVTVRIPSDATHLLLMTAVVGTTVTPYMFFYLQASVAEKGLGPEELGLERADAFLGALWTNVIAAFIAFREEVITRRGLFSGRQMRSPLPVHSARPSESWTSGRQSTR